MSSSPALPLDFAEALDPDALLPGEDPESLDRADAVRWLRVYRDLIELTTVLLERTESALKSMAGDAIREAGVDQRRLRMQRARYEARYEFWARRVDNA
jgi:hypothetical protein